MRGRTNIVEDFITRMKATSKALSGWLSRLWPMICGTAGVTVYVVAMPATDCLKAIKPSRSASPVLS
jgi:hypothetical protein